jgi:hypothetical protein
MSFNNRTTRYRPPRIEEKHTHEELQKALWDSDGDVEAASVIIGCTPKTLYSYMQDFPEAREVRNEAKAHAKRLKVERREKLLDQRAEQNKNLPVSFAALKYYLDTHGQEEGWGKITEQANEEQAKQELDKWSKYLDTLRPTLKETTNDKTT